MTKQLTATIHHKHSKTGSLVCIFFLALMCLWLLPSPSQSAEQPKTIIVGAYNNAPTIFVDNNGTVRGLFIDILEDIAKKEGWRLHYKIGEFDELFQYLESNKIDILPAVAYSADKESAIDYNFINVMPNWAEVYSLNTNNIETLLDLTNKTIGVRQNDIHFLTLRQMTEKFNIDCRFFEADDYQSVFEMLQANHVDLAVVDRLYGNNHKTQFGARRTQIIFNPIELRYAVPKGENIEIVGALDAFLTQFKSDRNSVYYQAIRRWLVTKAEGYTPKWLLRSLYVVIGLALFLTATVLVFKKQMNSRTRQLRETTLTLQSNIKEREKTAEILQKYERIVEASNDAMALLDKNHCHVLANSRYLKATGHIDSPIQGVPLKTVLGDDLFNEELKSGVGRCLAGEVVHVQTKPGPDETHKKYWNITLNPYRSSRHNIEGYVIDIRDVTEQVKLQNRLKNSQKMEAIGMLAGGVAHDLNNILSGLVSYPDILLLKASPDDPMLGPLQTIKKSGERAAAIVQDLLTLARRGIGNPLPVNINTIIREFWTSPEHNDITKDVEKIAYIFRLDENLPNILGSTAHLSKLLMNLFTNGLEAMEEGGKLTIGTSKTKLNEEHTGYETIPPAEYVELYISDTGVGMATPELNRVFEPFYTSKAMGRSGTGLGMAVVWGVIKDHGGYIDIQSTPGEGTTFKAFFPISHLAVPITEEQLSGSLKGQKEKILIIDDLKEQRTLAGEIVTELGYDVDLAPSGTVAVTMCAQQKYDLLILDMIMEEDMDGYATYKKIVEIWPAQKAIIASGFSESSRVKKAQRLGAGTYIKKPYSVKSLAESIRKELDSK